MYVPPGFTESEVLRAINEGLAMLAKHFVFGFYTLEDIRQEGYVCAIKALNDGKYDGKRSLPAFLYVVMKSRLINLMRDEFKRITDPPCVACHKGAPHAATPRCDLYREWVKRNERKANLMTPTDISTVTDGESNMRVEDETLAEVDRSMLRQRIDDCLAPELRSDYLRLLAGQTLSKGRRAKVFDAVRDILSPEEVASSDLCQQGK